MADGGHAVISIPAVKKRRGRSYRLGSSYKWRVIQFSALGETCRLLLVYNADKEQYRATLAIERERDMIVIASLEFHGTHPGWHLHGACGDVEAHPIGSLRGPLQKRFPNPRVTHRRHDFEVPNEGVALEVAAKFFRLHKTEGALI